MADNRKQHKQARNQAAAFTKHVNSHGPHLDNPTPTEIQKFHIANFPEGPHQWYVTSVTTAPGRSFKSTVVITRLLDNHVEQKTRSDSFSAEWLIDAMHELGLTIPPYVREAAQRAAARKTAPPTETDSESA